VIQKLWGTQVFFTLEWKSNFQTFLKAQKIAARLHSFKTFYRGRVIENSA
jgi:hypothetical protein